LNKSDGHKAKREEDQRSSTTTLFFIATPSWLEVTVRARSQYVHNLDGSPDLDGCVALDAGLDLDAAVPSKLAP